MATVALSGIITPTNVVTTTGTQTLTNKTLTGAVMNGTLGATTPSTVVATTVKASTTIGVGAATPSASGAGISFPATQSASSDANTLDDYEEGTFTVTTNGDATGAFSAQSGEYTKIGNVCTVRIAFSVSVNFTSGAIGGLPFTVAGSGSVSGVGFLGSVITGSSNESPIIAECDVATIVVSFYAVGDRGIAHEPNTTNDVYRLSMVYRTT